MSTAALQCRLQWSAGKDFQVLRLSQRFLWRVLSSGTWRCAIWQRFTNTSEERLVPIFRVTFRVGKSFLHLEHGRRIFLRNICKHLSDYGVISQKTIFWEGCWRRGPTRLNFPARYFIHYVLSGTSLSLSPVTADTIQYRKVNHVAEIPLQKSHAVEYWTHQYIFKINVMTHKRRTL